MKCLPIIAVTSGDPAGIGPEVCLKAIENAELPGCQLVVYGSAKVFSRISETLGSSMLTVTSRIDDALATLKDGRRAVLLDFDTLPCKAFQIGQVNAASGMASFRYIDSAIDDALVGRVDAITTGPIHKEALALTGIKYPGHTEIFAARTSSERACMMLTCDELTCSFVTTHVGYRDVPSLLNVKRILDVIELSHDAMRNIRQREPRLIICGLNPHAGENGLFGGGEEEEFIIPATKMAQSRGINIVGPLPPDTAFLPARRKEADCIVCMYHDQGHIPLKTLSFDLAVNTTLGLPIIRTSVDHGTALDIAGKGIADESSMVEAIRLATQLAASKRVDNTTETQTTHCTMGDVQ